MNDSKSIVVCDECGRKMRRRPLKFEEGVLYAIPDGMDCGVCRKRIQDQETPLLFNLRTRLFAYTYRVVNLGWIPPYQHVPITYPQTTTAFWTSNGTSTLDWSYPTYTFG